MFTFFSRRAHRARVQETLRICVGRLSPLWKLFAGCLAFLFAAYGVSAAPPTVANAITDVSVNEDAPDSTVDLSNVFDDVDDNNSLITKTAISSDDSLVTVTVESNNTLTLDYQANQFGVAVITVTGTSNGEDANDSFVVTVASEDDPPVVANALPDVGRLVR